MGFFSSCEILALATGYTRSKKGPKLTKNTILFVTSNNWPAKKCKYDNFWYTGVN